MKLVALPFVLSVAKCHALRAGDEFFGEELGDAVARQLKVHIPACRCPDGFQPDLERHTCMKTLEELPEELCVGGEIIDGLCLVPANSALECPEGYISACKKFDTATSPCCAKAETADHIKRCRDGAEKQGGTCKRIISTPAKFECPNGYSLEGHIKTCIRKEIGKATTSCASPARLSEDGEACLTKMVTGLEFRCPEGYECISDKKKHKFGSPLCSACMAARSHTPSCGCGEGQHEENGLCFDAETFHMCQNRQRIPMKQAPPSKFQAAPPSKLKAEPIKCPRPEPVSCTCEHPFVLSCNGSDCTCTHHEIVPVQPFCHGTLEDGHCLAEVRLEPIYRCEEGFTCDPIDKKGRCECVRILSQEPTASCASGPAEGGSCNEAISESETLACPPGFTESCCDGSCTCTKTHMAPRELTCGAGAASVAGQCFFVSQPSVDCVEGKLQGEKCINEFVTAPICE